MDSTGQIGPSSGDYSLDVREIADKLSVGQSVFVTLADDGAKTKFVVASRDSLALVGQGPDGAPRDEGYVFVAVDGRGAYFLRTDEFQRPGYIASKLNVDTSRAQALAEFVARLGLALAEREVTA